MTAQVKGHNRSLNVFSDHSIASSSMSTKNYGGRSNFRLEQGTISFLICSPVRPTELTMTDLDDPRWYSEKILPRKDLPLEPLQLLLSLVFLAEVWPHQRCQDLLWFCRSAVLGFVIADFFVCCGI